MYERSISSFDNVIASLLIVHGIRTNDGARICRRWMQSLGSDNDLLGRNYLTRRHRHGTNRLRLISVNRALLDVSGDRNFNSANARTSMVGGVGHRDDVPRGIAARS